ncbi:MAG TPA: S-methyl-5-thioribose-1-phosphate isomerase [Candidatus Eremiobacteraceae bacterium]|nr:S-methyl-5-thioribose-1-phosphate isomerase [Candidatus Eremiobacteraceae bacterium]
MVSAKHISYTPGELRILDQTKLPAAVEFLTLRTWPDVAGAIAQLRVRGAPAIGIAAAYGIAIEAHNLAGQQLSNAAFFEGLERAGQSLSAARPTAVNLGWAVKRMLAAAQPPVLAGAAQGTIAASLDTEARAIHEEDIAACRRIGDHGAALFPGPVRVLTHCNTGDLATGGYGTALGIVRSLWKAGKLQHVYVDETRPVLQGARLTVWELQQDQIPYTLIADSMAAHFMQRKTIDAVVVGADRIASNGDTANKIGTYGLAVLAKAHGIPFVVAAPRSTFDPSLTSGAAIVIEERNPDELRTFGAARSAPPDATVANPAFDVTPAEYIGAIVTETGTLKPPFETSIAQMISGPTYAETAP